MIKIATHNLNSYYGNFQALKDVNIAIKDGVITSFIGPSGCGKTTLLRTLNRMNDLIEGARIEGKVFFDGKNIYANGYDLTILRRKIGMVFQRPNPFPLSIFDNVVYGLRLIGKKQKNILLSCAQDSLSRVFLWDKLKDKLDKNALELTAEEQQRLCIARLLTVDPQVLLLDEPCSTLDPIATERIEKLLISLKKKYTIIIVTHNMQQASRISDYTGFFLLGEMIEFGQNFNIFTKPKDKRTEDYIEGRFG